MIPFTVFYTGFNQVIFFNINSILTLLLTNTKCYWMVMYIMADRDLYGHLNPQIKIMLKFFSCLVKVAFALLPDIEVLPAELLDGSNTSVQDSDTIL